jgi:hypothetical protein
VKAVHDKPRRVRLGVRDVSLARHEKLREAGAGSSQHCASSELGNHAESILSLQEGT